MKTSDQYGDYSARMNRGLGKPFKPLVVIFLALMALVLVQAGIEHYFPSIRMAELSYPHGIKAEVYYNTSVGVPIVDSTMSYAELEFAELVDSVNWFVPDDAQAFYIASIVQADLASIERYLNQTPEP